MPSETISAVLSPFASTCCTARSIRSACAGSAREYLNIIATEMMVANGLAIFFPAISGADPWIGSYIPFPPAFNEAEGNIPIEPVNMEARSDNMSPNILVVTITSNCLGSLTNCMAALSTYMCSRLTSG